MLPAVCVNSELSPSGANESLFLYEYDESIVAKFPCTNETGGKWIMCFKRGEMDVKWAEARRLYR